MPQPNCLSDEVGYAISAAEVSTGEAGVVVGRLHQSSKAGGGRIGVRMITPPPTHTEPKSFFKRLP
ncbi:MAG: hypothetical protein OXC62_05235 [Aestuariivita sp.]|nr:hypothetical protein [Aestuariivita sp.]